MLLHSPNELPEVDFYGLGVSNGAESRIVATPILTKASKAVQNMPMKIRQCIFESENFLTLYRLVATCHRFEFVEMLMKMLTFLKHFQDIFAKGKLKTPLITWITTYHSQRRNISISMSS